MNPSPFEGSRKHSKYSCIVKRVVAYVVKRDCKMNDFKVRILTQKAAYLIREVQFLSNRRTETLDLGMGDPRGKIHSAE